MVAKVKLRALIPAPINEKEFALAFGRIQDKAGADLNRYFKDTINGWTHRPVFKVTVKVSRIFAISTVITDDKIYGWVNFGTKRHNIDPVNAVSLRFQPFYTPATTPGVLRSGKSSSSGGFISAQEVSHPGIKARRMDRAIVKEYRPTYLKMVKREINIAIKRSQKR